MKDGSAGEFKWTAGKWFGDAAAGKGIQTGPDSKYFALYSELKKPFTNDKKDLVLQVRARVRRCSACPGGVPIALAAAPSLQCTPMVVTANDQGRSARQSSAPAWFGPNCTRPQPKWHQPLLLLPPPFFPAPQFAVKHEQEIDCGGGYIKLIPASRCALDMSGRGPHTPDSPHGGSAHATQPACVAGPLNPAAARPSTDP